MSRFLRSVFLSLQSFAAGRIARIPAWVMVGLAGSAAVHAQVPAAILVAKVGVHEQVSAATVNPLYVGFLVDVYLPEAVDSAVTVALQKPGGASTLLAQVADNTFSLGEYFYSEADLTAAYPDGAYQMIVTGGGKTSTSAFNVAASSIQPARITNFDALQAASANPSVTWQAIPAHGTDESLTLALSSSGGITLSSETLSTAAATTANFSGLLAGETYAGSLTYFGLNLSKINDGQTDLGIGGGFALIFSVLRGAPVAAAPTAPAAAGAFASGPTTVTLTWQPPAGPNPPLTYKLERAADESFTTGLMTLNLFPSTSYIDAGVSANSTYYYRLSAGNSIGTSAPTPSMRVTTPAAVAAGETKFVNIAARAQCGAGNNVTIGGFVVTGSAAKRVLVRAVGPSLTAQGLAAGEILPDPNIEVHQGVPVVASNDNWQDEANAAEITSVGAQIGATALLASDTKSSALLLTLSPGVYSFVVNGKSGSGGVVLLEVYDADVAPNPAKFANIATRAYATTGNGVTIGGFVVAGGAPKQVLLRAVGPTLTSQGLSSSEVLANPVIELHRGSAVIATNDNWVSNENAGEILTTGARIGATPFAAMDTSSSALLLDLPPGVYSFVVRGKSDTSGIVLIEVYDAD